ncbi:MAG: hypothetical protein ACK55I_43305, partial [bacterium]
MISDTTSYFGITENNSNGDTTFAQTITSHLVSSEDTTLSSDDTSSLAQFITVEQIPSISTTTSDETTSECDSTISDDSTTFSKTIYTSIAITNTVTSTPIVQDPFTQTTTPEVSTTHCDTTVISDTTSYFGITENNSNGDTTFAQTITSHLVSSEDTTLSS